MKITRRDFAVMTAASGREALARVVRFVSLVTNHGGRWEMEETDEALHARWLRPGERSLGHRAANESVLAEFLHVSRQILGSELEALAVSFKHAAPSDTRVHAEHFGVSPKWQADEDELVLPKVILSRVPSFANPALRNRHASNMGAVRRFGLDRAGQVLDQDGQSPVQRARRKVGPAGLSWIAKPRVANSARSASALA